MAHCLVPGCPLRALGLELVTCYRQRVHKALRQVLWAHETQVRDEIEEALRCLKQDGTVARLAKTWLGTTPGPEDLENLVIPGYGVPGLAGYDPKPHKPRCGK